MKKSKIVLALLLAFVLVFGVVSLVACNDPSNSGNGGGKNKPTEIVMWAPSGAQAFYREWVDKWAADYVDAQGRTYTVKLGVMSEGDASSSLTTSPTDGADVFLFADDQVAELYRNGVLADLGTGPIAEEIKARNNESSVESASYDGKLLAYPMQSDNTYFLYYRADMLDETDVQTWDGIFDKVAEINGDSKDDRVKVQFAYGTGWYQASWFFTFGGTVTETTTNFDKPEVGYKALQAAYEFSNRNDITFLDPGADMVAGLLDGSLAAGVSGTWIYEGDFKEAIQSGDIKTAILPKIRLSTDPAGEESSYHQTRSFLSSKLIGVNAQTALDNDFLIAAHSLANYLTSYDVQLDKAIRLGAGPSNIEAAKNEEVATIPTIQAASMQSEFANPQINLPKGFWKALEKLLPIVDADKTGGDYFNPDGTIKDSAGLDTLLAELKSTFFDSIPE